MENPTTTGKKVSIAGLDISDKYSRLCVLDSETGDILEESRLPTTAKGLLRRFQGVPQMRIALEVGTHSPWISRLLESWGHEVLVANARRLRMIYASRQKTDRMDAHSLARVARMDPRLLYPIQHRGPQGQADLALLRSREALVRSRTRLTNHTRGVVKSLGCRLPSCGPEAFPKRAGASLPEVLRPALTPLLEIITTLNQRIRAYDRQIAQLCRQRYPQTELLRQIRGVGPITALAFVLILEDPGRYRKSRTVGSYLGLVPAVRESGDTRLQLRITKQGNAMLRRLLVGCAQYMLGAFGEDCDLRRFGQRIAERGGKNAKRRAVVAVARKLAVLLHHLWSTAEVYQPLRQVEQAA